MANIRKHMLFYIVSILFVLVLVSLFLLSGIYAKYTISASIEESARVAKFDVGSDGGMFETSYAVEIDPISTETINDALALVNSSEVAVECNLTVTSFSDLPLLLTWKDGDKTYSAKVGEQVKLAYEPCSAEQTFDLIVGWDNSNESNNSFLYRRQVDKLVLNVECKQID